MRTRHQVTASLPATIPGAQNRNKPDAGDPAGWRIKNILVPTDFSKASKKALKYAEELARQFNARITILHVVEPMPTADFGAYPIALSQDQLLKEMKRTLDLFSRRKVAKNLLKETKISVGRPFQEITDAARNLKVDLIVIATHGYTGLKHAFLGSTAERVVRHAPCPVLTVREKETKTLKR